MVMGNNLIITTFIVVTVIVCGVLRRCLLLVTSCPNEVYRLVVKDFLLLVGGKVLCLTTLQNGYKRMVRNSSRCAEKLLNTPAGDSEGTGGSGSGNRRSSSNSSWVAPWANFLACCRLMYWSISSSPAISSSSTTILGEDGVSNDCWLELGDVTVYL